MCVVCVCCVCCVLCACDLQVVSCNFYSDKIITPEGLIRSNYPPVRWTNALLKLVFTTPTSINLSLPNIYLANPLYKRYNEFQLNGKACTIFYNILVMDNIQVDHLNDNYSTPLYTCQI